MHSMGSLLIWLSLIISAGGSGYLIYRAFNLPSSTRLETLLVSFAIGLGLFIYGTAALGFFHILSIPFIFLMAGFVSLLSIVGYYYLWREYSILESDLKYRNATSVYPLWGIKLASGLFFFVYFLSTLTPPLDGDTLHSYLDIPRQYLDAKLIIDLPYELLSILPMNIQMLSTMALALKGDELAQMLASFTMVVGCGLTIVVIGRRYLTNEIGWLAGLIFISMRAVINLIPTTKVNLGFAFFDLLSIYAICRWAFDVLRNDHWLIIGGVLSGMALGANYYAGFTAIILVICIVIASYKDGLRKSVIRVIYYGVPVVLLSSPWLVKNYLYVGNPFAPILNPFLNLPREELIVHTRSILGLVTIFWDMATGPIAKYGFPVGPVMLLIVPFIFLIKPVPKKLWVAIIFFFSLYIFWYFGVQRPRNLLTGFGLLSLISAFIYVELGKRSHLLRDGFIVLLTIFLLFNWGVHAYHCFIHPFQYQNYILGVENRDKFLKRILNNSPNRASKEMITYMNDKLPKDARILAINDGVGYYIHRPYIDSRMVDGDFSSDTANNLDDLLSQWNQVGITHIYINKNAVGEFKEGDKSRGFAMFVISDPNFRKRCLEEKFTHNNRYLYSLTCL